MVKFKVKWSIEARLDLIDILEFYLVRNGNPIYSKKLNADIERSTFQISKNPQIGLQTDIDSIRVLIQSDFQIIYEIIDDVVLVIMIWDFRRNPDDRKIGHRINH